MGSIGLTNATIGFLDVPRIDGASIALAKLLPLEQAHQELLIQCHGQGQGVRYLVEWCGDGEAPQEVREALRIAGVTLTTEEEAGHHDPR